MGGVTRRTASKEPSSGKGKSPATSAPKEGEIISPGTGRKLSINDAIAIFREVTAFMHEAAGYLSEREKTKQAMITSQYELERINSALEQARMKHEQKMRRLDRDDRIVEVVVAQLSDLRKAIQPFLAEFAELDLHQMQALMGLLDKITTLQANLLEQCRN